MAKYHTEKCKHTDCDYQHGWDYTKSTSDPTWVDGGLGDFYEVKAFIEVAFASRYHGDKNKRKMVGCPKCDRFFMGEVIDDGELL
jgi:hypothetical protein